jgi:DNA-binding SARP family transcriptional activator
MSLELAPAFLMSILACWLGLSLLVRAPRDAAAQAFAWLCLHLTLYGLTITLGKLSPATNTILPALHRLELVTTTLLPPAFLHFVMIVAGVGRGLRAQRLMLAVTYVIGVALAGYALFAADIVLDTVTPRFPSGPLTSLSIAHRSLPLLLAAALAYLSFRLAGDDRTQRQRRLFFTIAAAIAVTGAFLAALAREIGFQQAPGHLLMDAGLAMMAYMVLAYRMLLPARVARRAFYRSLLGGSFTAVYVGGLLTLEPLSRATLGIDTPLVTLFAIVILIAVLGPLRDVASSWLDRRFFHREFDYSRLLQAISKDFFELGDLAGQLEAGLAAICRTLNVRAGVVAVQEGTVLRIKATYGPDRPDAEAFRTLAPLTQAETHYGDWEPWPAAQLLLPLYKGKDWLGFIALGPKRSGEPYREVERVLLNSLGSYMSAAIVHDHNQKTHEFSMAALAEQSRQVEVAQQQLAAQAVEYERLLTQRAAPDKPAGKGLRVFALGPLRVERDGAAVERWGGDKAGTYQAEALFAFLFDRRGRGVTKDEAEEVIWPDLDIKALDKADTAFHRTLSGLRRTLEPGLRRGNESRLITYHHERYWLDPSSIGWCDVDEFVSAIEEGHTLLRRGDLETSRERFRHALSLYRADYMHDCPFFGDSAYVEERRDELRSQFVDALIALGAVYERLGQAGEAATCYRRAIAASLEECPRAEEGLARLQVGAP